MARRPRDRTGERIEAFIKVAAAVIALLALAIGGIQHFLPALLTIVLILLGLVVAFAVGLVAYRLAVRAGAPLVPSLAAQTTIATTLNRRGEWTASRVREALDEIDWYQFEKFCAELLRAEGFAVTRQGGAQPDGGVDLLVEQSGSRALIQCKHWRIWVVQERVVREMLGSMTHFGVKQGAIYTLKGWTAPAKSFADSHGITLVNGDELAQSAALQLTSAQLHELLRTDVHHCPKCEAPMMERSGAFGSFWGCSRFPSCRGKLKHRGAR